MWCLRGGCLIYNAAEHGLYDFLGGEGGSGKGGGLGRSRDLDIWLTNGKGGKR